MNVKIRNAIQQIYRSLNGITPNKTCEAYTGNFADRREFALPEARLASKIIRVAIGDRFISLETEMK